MKVAFAAVDRSARKPGFLPTTLTATLVTFSVTGIVSDWSTTFGIVPSGYGVLKEPGKKGMVSVQCVHRT